MSLQPAGGFDALAASIRADSQDLRTFLDVLADKMQSSLPGHVQVERDWGLLKHNHPVRRLTVTLDDRRYLLMWSNGSLVAEIDSVPANGVAGFRPIALEEWVDRLAGDVARFANSTAGARTAMDSLLEGKGRAVTIARGADQAAKLVALWPDSRLTGTSEIQVAEGDQAVVLLDAQGLKGPYGPGSTPLWKVALEVGVADATGDPEQAQLMGRVYFVSAGEHPGFRFGGTVDKVADPDTGLAVGLRVFGDYSVRVKDGAKLIGILASTLPQVTDEAVSDLLRDLLLRSFRTAVVKGIESSGWHILGLSGHADEIEKATLEQARAGVDEYGLDVPRMGNFTISMKDEDERLLTEYRAQHAGPGGGAGTRCPSCGAGNAAGAKFCSSCGHPLALTCAACGAQNEPTARFCSTCGKPLAIAAGGTGAG